MLPKTALLGPLRASWGHSRALSRKVSIKLQEIPRREAKMDTTKDATKAVDGGDVDKHAVELPTEPILSTDDLVMKIGELTVAGMHDRLLIEKLHKQLLDTAKRMSYLEAIEQRAKQLETSNAALSKKNLEMDKLLTETRQQCEVLRAQFAQEQAHTQDLQAELKLKAAALQQCVEQTSKKKRKRREQDG